MVCVRDEEKRERILETSRRLFGSEGYYGTRVADVAREARISPKTLYAYFPSKKELFIATRDAALGNLIEDVLEAFAGQPDDLDSLAVMRNAFETYGDYIRNNRGMARILAEGIAIVDEGIQSEQQAGFEVAVEAASALMESDVTGSGTEPLAGPYTTALLLMSFAAILAYAVMLDLDRMEEGGFDPGYALALFFEVMRKG